mmetsp:Transcript_8612/g.12708  ORF Transcript_8612/g.12708 Transcript_8612/m.12708 type:complete len:148 (+) Transcript_8612:26-469(+)
MTDSELSTLQSEIDSQANEPVEQTNKSMTPSEKTPYMVNDQMDFEQLGVAMSAFGGRETSILKQIDTITQIQVDSLLSSMEIELKYPNCVDDGINEPTSSYYSFEKSNFNDVSNQFKEKETSVIKLGKKLQSISRAIDKINKEINQN